MENARKKDTAKALYVALGPKGKRSSTLHKWHFFNLELKRKGGRIEKHKEVTRMTKKGRKPTKQIRRDK